MPLAVIGLQADNFMRLEAVQLQNLDPNLVLVTGANDQGKSSLINALFMALTSGRDRDAIEMPVRQGAERASVRVTLGDGGVTKLIVEKVWNPSGPELNVWEADTYNRIRSPQAMLDALKGAVAMDPLRFARMDKSARGQVLLGLLGIGPKLAEIDRRKTQAYDLRRDHNRDVKRLQGAVGAHGSPDPDAHKLEHLDEEDIRRRQKESNELWLAYEEKKRKRTSIRDTYRTVSDRVRDIRLEIQRLEEEVKAKEADLAGYRAQAEEMDKELEADSYALPDREDLEAEMSQAVRVRDQVAHFKRFQELSTELKAAMKAASKEDRAVEQAEQERLELIANADYPIEGLAYDEKHGVLFDGVPFDQISSSKRIRASLAIAMAEEPELRILRISDGSLLDKDSLAEVEAAAREHGFQVWVEMVDESGKLGITIHEGRVVGGAPELAEPDTPPEQPSTEDDDGPGTLFDGSSTSGEKQ